MHTTLETYVGFRFITNYEGVKRIFDMELVLMLEMMERLPPTPRRSYVDVGNDGDANGETPSYTKDELVVMIASRSPRWRPWSSIICPYP
jgi:hypothetical protein